MAQEDLIKEARAYALRVQYYIGIIKRNTADGEVFTRIEELEDETNIFLKSI